MEIKRIGIDHNALMKALSGRTSEIFDLLKFGPVDNKSSQVRTRECPFHDDTSESHIVSVANNLKGRVTCEKDKESRDIVELYSAVTGLDRDNAIIEMCAKLEIDVPRVQVGRG